MKPVVHHICSFCEHTDESSGPIWEDYYNLFAEESILPIASLVYEDFEEFLDLHCMMNMTIASYNMRELNGRSLLVFPI